ncbi:MAG: molybdate ABC transporter substrate-binding protein [Chloroflexi bacterium RBG_13_57_8]|nr:MAG: molybdate ABC transporter substrate-binding protein [Chloroflexi bacterium RBG_13_57_8]
MPVKKVILALIGVALIMAVGGCTGTGPKTLTAFVGSASKPPMEEAARVFQEKTGIVVYLTFGGSGSLLSQIELSKSGDLYIPGSPDYMVKAEHKDIVDPASVKLLAYLIPVIAVPSGNPLGIKSLADLARPGLEVGIGNPEAVCLGLYSIEILDYNHLLEDAGKNIVVHAKSCEDTATLISLKSVDAVIGWDVFQHWDPDNIEVVYLAPEQLPRIAYIPAGVTRFAQDVESAREFLQFLISPEGQAIFQKWGYITTEEDARKYTPAAAIGGEYQLPDKYSQILKNGGS